jgi:hypothetical protein
MELGRLHPGQWMLVAKVTKSTPKVSLRAINRDRNQIEGWLERHASLERWELRTITVAGTICDRELYMRYLHTLTPEEDAEDRRQRREASAARMVVVRANRERRAAEARRRAAEDEAAAQVRIRGRRRGRG